MSKIEIKKTELVWRGKNDDEGKFNISLKNYKINNIDGKEER
ncbi:MAG TPA: hypothetical protein PL087_09905 [Bacteroidales bacterium]|nr:hypothetical protein [Bacteroidales bacterium]